MIRGKSHRRGPDPLLLLAAAVVLGAVMTTAVTAGELFNFFPGHESAYRLAPQDSGYTVVRMGHSGGGLHVSLTPPRELPHDFQDSGDSAQGVDMLSHIYLYLRYPW